MLFTGFALFFGTSLIGHFLPVVNASPLPTTTASVPDEFHILPITLPTHGPHRINISSLIIELPASLVKKNEHPEPTSLCGENCRIINGECKCPPKIPMAMCNAPCKFIEGECICPQRDDTPWPFVGPDGLITPAEETYPGVTADLTPIDPQIIASLEKHATLELRAVDREKSQPTVFLCHEDPECNKGHAAPFTAEAAVISKRDPGHPTLSERGDQAEATITQTSTTTHFPTPTPLIPACARHDVKCLNQHRGDEAEPTPTQTSGTSHSPHPTALIPACACDDVKCLNLYQDNHKNTSELIHLFQFIRTCTLEHPPTPTAAVMDCPENDRQCQGSFLPPPLLEKDIAYRLEKFCNLFEDHQACRGISPAKEEKVEKRDEDIVLLPNAIAVPELTSKAEKEEESNEDIVLPPNANAIPDLSTDVRCNGKPWICF